MKSGGWSVNVGMDMDVDVNVDVGMGMDMGMSMDMGMGMDMDMISSAEWLGWMGGLAVGLSFALWCPFAALPFLLLLSKCRARSHVVFVVRVCIVHVHVEVVSRIAH